MMGGSLLRVEPHAETFWSEYKALGELAQRIADGSHRRWTKSDAMTVISKLKTMEGCARILMARAPTEAPFGAPAASVPAPAPAAAGAEEVSDEVLLAAAVEGDLAMVESLLARGADIEAVDDNGYTALHHAAKWGHALIAKVICRGR